MGHAGKTSFRALYFGFIALVSINTAVHADQSASNLATLVHDTVEAALTQQYSPEQYRIKVLPVPAAAHLKPCTEMRAEIKSKHLYGRVPVHVRCEAPSPWSLYASAEVTVEVPVVTSLRAIARGERITRDAIALTPQALQLTRTQTLTRLEDALGKVARRALQPNRALTLNHLMTPDAVTKGERVQISANNGRVQIQAFGTALANGKIGERIQVRNDISRRIIHPWVIAPGQVATRPPGFGS